MSEYTNDEIAQAIHVAAHDRMGSIDINHDTSQEPHQIHVSLLYDLREILDALPDRQDDWQECPMFGAPKPGDRLRIRWAWGDVHEGVITSRSIDHIQLDSTQVNRRDNARLEYIPAPIVTPDPAEHPTIIVREIAYALGNTSGKVYEQALWNHGSSDNGRYNTSAGRELRPERIIDWAPAKMTEVGEKSQGF